MKKNTLIIVSIIAVVVIIAAAGLIRFSFTNGGSSSAVTGPDVKSISYAIGGELFALKNGMAQVEYTPGSATKNTLSVFGEPVYGDLNNDGTPDAALMLVNNPGGSGAFYYAVLAINEGGMYRATNALLLGDRIAPQTVEIHDGRAVFNYAERRANEPMTVQPSVGKSLWIQYDKNTGEIGEWVQGFEGEADPARMTLGMTTWRWMSATTPDGKAITPKRAGVFTLAFGNDGRVSVHTDCNSGGGTYTARNGTLTFGPMASTKMYCEGSQEDEFNSFLGLVSGYRFTSKGELILTLKQNTGEMTFRSAPVQGSGVTGTVTLGPVCPVERIPPDPACAPKAYTTTIQVIKVASPQGAAFATTKSDSRGKYSVTLPPGVYALQPIGGNPLPRCETKEVTVVASEMLAVNLSCDTGIR